MILIDILLHLVNCLAPKYPDARQKIDALFIRFIILIRRCGGRFRFFICCPGYLLVHRGLSVIVFFARPAGRQLNLAQFSVNERNIMSYTTLHCITWRDFNARAYAV
jgi:hypothetical protein